MKTTELIAKLKKRTETAQVFLDNVVSAQTAVRVQIVKDFKKGK